MQDLKDKFDGGGDQAFMIDLYWGIKDIDSEGGVYWDPTFIGKAIMDPEFDLSPKEAQNAILTLCKDLRDQEFVKNKNVKCWLESFDLWL